MSTLTATLAPPPAFATARPIASARMANSRIIGALYLVGFLAYGVGFSIATSVISAPDFLTTIATHSGTLALGALLTLLTFVTEVWRAVVFFPILGERGRSAALTYLAAQTISVVFFFIGALFLLLIVPLGQMVADTGGASGDWAWGLGSLLVQSNAIAYQISQMALAFGSLALWLFAFRVRLIPRVFAAWGLVGYVVLLAGCIAEIFGVHIGLMLSIPGGLFEIALPLWLFVKGFNPEAYGKA